MTTPALLKPSTPQRVRLLLLAWGATTAAIDALILARLMHGG